MFDPSPVLDNLLRKLLHPQLRVIDPSLERIVNLLEVLGDPHSSLPPVVHIAGTNGKGSLLALLRSILKTAGYRVHAYTSPHLVHFNERILVNHQPIENERLMPLLEHVLSLQEKYPATFFEATTAAALMAFAEEPADFILLETGMGGRLDATNVIPSPAVTAITPIGRDHAEFLGETISAIAGEKAGIIKRGSPCIIGPQIPEAREVLQRKAQEVSALPYIHQEDWYFTNYKDDGNWEYHGGRYSGIYPRPALQGEHQIANAATALAVLEQLGDRVSLTQEQIGQGLQSVFWPARLQPLTEGYWRNQLTAPTWRLYLDGGHNPHAAAVIAEWLKTQPSPVYVIMGMLNNKEIQAYLSILQHRITHLYAVAIPQESGCYTAQEITTAATSLGIHATACESPEVAMAKVNQQQSGTVLIAGSLYFAGYVLGKL